ncbi:hypothetical protein [Pseudonocardia sp. HH130630-07]|uniref:hypothetical protein n=1 Tax=Pseudonocardia sp. HH130630-07 TaxID=1690815 RepID=UPI000814D535|nr:hypothetical protein [Pseudonocardia sp. HH130630-07]ANY10703.1 hypothetical protein AFB00_30315 [Pseudonocardia sp. HH130630-07]
MTHRDRPWAATTHDWSRDVDADHLQEIRRHPRRHAATGVLHLVLEVVAYAADEAESLGRRGRCLVRLHPDGSVLVADDGRGTDTRLDTAGAVVRKPIMATRDLRFFDADAPPLLGDGHARRGISVVAALSTSLVHVNRRCDGAWSQTYRDGLPVGDLVEVAGDGTTGTAVRFTPCEAVRAIGGADAPSIHSGTRHLGELLRVTVNDLR